MRTWMLLLFFLFYSFVIFGQSENQLVNLYFSDIEKLGHQENLIADEQGISQNDKGAVAIFVSDTLDVKLKEIAPFLAFSFRMEGSGFLVEEMDLYVRSTSLKINSDWQEVHSSHEASPKDSIFISELLFLDETTTSFQVKIILKPVISAGVVIKHISFNLFSPGAQKLNLMDHSTQNDPSLDCYCPLPDFITRSEWGCPDGQEPSCYDTAYTQVSHLVLHHSAGPNVSDDWPAVVLSFWDYHVNGHGWCDIGYNWLVDPEGVLYEGRGGGDNIRGAHFSCANTYTMGVCVIGNFMDTYPSEVAKDKLVSLLAWKSCKDDLNPLAVVYHSPTELDLPVICGHRDSNASEAPNACPSGTACPGDNFYLQLEDIRQQVDERMSLPFCGGDPPPINDSCENAQLITFHETCEWTEASVAGATPSGMDQVSCSDYYGFPSMEDVWFSFVADTQAMGIKVNPSQFFDPVIAIYDECQGNELFCADMGGGNGGSEFIDYYDYVPGQTYFLRVYHYGRPDPLTSTFEVCLTRPFGYPIALFEATETSGSNPLSIDFIDLSFNNPNTWNWVFEGAEPGSSTVQNPQNITYPDAGFFDVSLYVSNDYGQDSVVYEDYIWVSATGVEILETHPYIIFPNPFDEQIHIQFESNLNSQFNIQLLSFSGQSMDQNMNINKIGEQQALVNTSNLKQGIYFLRIDDGNSISFHKVIKY